MSDRLTDGLSEAARLAAAELPEDERALLAAILSAEADAATGALEERAG